MPRKQHSKLKIILIIALCVFLMLSFYFGDLDPRNWLLIKTSSELHHLIANVGKIVFQGGTGGSGGTSSSEAQIKVYWESSCLTEVSSIDWGALSPGESKVVIVYIKNIGSAALTLALSTENWNPAIAGQYMTLTWDYGNQAIQASEILGIALTLTVSPSITGVTGFSFDLVISTS